MFFRRKKVPPEASKEERQHLPRWNRWRSSPASPAAAATAPRTDSSATVSGDEVPHATLVAKGTLSKSQHHVDVDNSLALQDDDPRIFLTARHMDEHQIYRPSLGVLVDQHSRYFTDPLHRDVIEKGGVLFSFSCSKLLDPYDMELVMNTINLSSYTDETTENYVPHIRKEGLLDFTIVIAKSAYMLPGADLAFVCDPAFVSSVAYQKACEPSSNYIWDDGTEPNTFRLTKPVIAYLFSVTIQFRVSRLSPEDLERFSSFLGLRVDGGLLMERTKRSKPPKDDRTRKAKSVLLYTQVPGGLYVTHLTVILQSSIPTIVAKFIHRFGAWGLTEALETAGKTRRYLEEQQEESWHSKATTS